MSEASPSLLECMRAAIEAHRLTQHAPIQSERSGSIAKAECPGQPGNPFANMDAPTFIAKAKRILRDIEVSRISAVNFPCQEHALATITKSFAPGDYSDLVRSERAQALRKRVAHLRQQAQMTRLYSAITKELAHGRRSS